MIKKGHLIEFTDDWYQHYPPKDTSVIKYGIAIEDTDAHRDIKVQRGDGSIEIAKHIHASGWAGWVPDELEELINNNPENWDYDL